MRKPSAPEILQRFRTVFFKRKRLPALILMLLLPLAAHAQATSHKAALRALTPPAGKLLAGSYIGDETGEEDVLTPQLLRDYIRTTGHRPAWIYFSNNWYRSRAFPAQLASWIRSQGSTPFIRLMLRSDDRENHAEPLFTPQAIARGDFDADLAAWGRAAAKFKTPILAEYGTEVNGKWFPWNGKWHGRARGTRAFAAAYRHIIDVTRANGASNIVWVFHVNWNDHPDRRWNRFENYYPGDAYIDWLGVSLYSMLGPHEDELTPFSAIDNTMKRLHQMAPSKPVIIAEFGTDVNNPREPAAAWATAALKQILSNRWPQLIGFSWWNEQWPNGDNPENATDLRIQSDPALTQVFRKALKHPRIVR